MSFTINCPICGRRDAYEFSFGNEDKGPSPDQRNLTREQFIEHFIRHPAVAGPQKEWWFHKEGCGSWFTIIRDTITGREVNNG
jgi:sarcosine oxidase subunit delta